MQSELASVAAQYAQAMLDLAQDSGGQVDETVLIELEVVNKVIALTPELGLVLEHPAVTGLEKKHLLIDAFKGKIGDLTLRLLEFLADRRKLNLLKYIEARYRELLNVAKGKVVATLVSADTLSKEAVASIEEKLARQLGKKVECEIQVDRSLIGGVVLQVGDQVFDGSLRGKLRALEKQLLSV
ncbi:MAG: ATP synthase F1 subunit delta [Candidatus Melainabacteria bacterium]|nr:ATP synthase F1 subunit delta [Candidatus Melainabacteria bacterium]